MKVSRKEFDLLNESSMAWGRCQEWAQQVEDGRFEVVGSGKVSRKFKAIFYFVRYEQVLWARQYLEQNKKKYLVVYDKEMDIFAILCDLAIPGIDFKSPCRCATCKAFALAVKKKK